MLFSHFLITFLTVFWSCRYLDQRDFNEFLFFREERSFLMFIVGCFLSFFSVTSLVLLFFVIVENDFSLTLHYEVYLGSVLRQDWWFWTVLWFFHSIHEEFLRFYWMKNLFEGFYCPKASSSTTTTTTIIISKKEQVSDFPQFGVRTSLGIAVVLSSIMFSLLHLGNPSITLEAMISLFILSLFFTAPIIYSGGLLSCSIGIHFVWNWGLSSVFGFAVSGYQIPSQCSIITFFPPHLRRVPHLLSGGAFGPEGGMLTLLALLFLLPVFPIALAVFTPRDRKCNFLLFARSIH